ncbi:MAG: 3'-5' exonuclease [Tissierellaceae bacterium]|nr:3'-5' exonuclease [Tissierellaceae bacterium]
MYYIVLDLEFNQDFPSLQDVEMKRQRSFFEIIQIGAIKLDAGLNNIDVFNRYIKPMVYSEVSSYVTDLTGITSEQIIKEDKFPEVYDDFIEFVEGMDSVFCTWGMSDMRILFKNTDYHKTDNQSMPKSYINLQPYASKFLGLSSKKLLSLEYALEALGIDTQYKFHNAANDAYYTAEIFKEIYNPFMDPKQYDPNYVKPRPPKIKRVVNYDALLNQFQKMYARDITKEEQEMISLAYLMGKTHQFLEEEEKP